MALRMLEIHPRYNESKQRGGAKRVETERTALKISEKGIKRQAVRRFEILLPIGKAPRRGGEGYNQSISQSVTKSFRSPPRALQHPNRVKNI